MGRTAVIPAVQIVSLVKSVEGEVLWLGVEESPTAATVAIPMPAQATFGTEPYPAALSIFGTEPVNTTCGNCSKKVRQNV